MTADFSLEVGEVHDIVDVAISWSKVRGSQLSYRTRLMDRRLSTFATALNTDQT